VKQANFTAGCDPELFVEQDGEFFAAPQFVKGTKSEPEPLPSGGFVMYDNVAIEFGIPPAKSENEFVGSITTAIKELRDYLPDGFGIIAIPSAHFPEGQLMMDECREFGCEPDYNAWTGKMNIIADSAADDTFRSCGGHFHVGHWYAKKNPREFIQWMDYANGMISVKLDNSEAALARRKLYGKAGCYRETEYGVEYRTLSNFWIQDEQNIRLQYRLVNDVVNAVEYGKIVLPDLEPDLVQKVINNGDVAFSSEIIKNYLWEPVFSDKTKGLLKEMGYNPLKG
jgi:hypothetical protein